MQFGTSASPAAVCINTKTDAVQIDYYALKYNDIKTTEFETIVHLELYGVSLYDEESVDILRQLRKFQNLDTISLVTPLKPPLGFLVQTQDHSDVVLFLAYAGAIAALASELEVDMKKPQYDTWKKPLLNIIRPRYDGSRFTEDGEFNPSWSLGVSSTHSHADFAKSTLARRLEELRCNRET
ncbi:hypothetical protein VF21_00168 [Pseudogymnoascus sp. 05NY08]|nr:hypothetical protein VF21_00127 [Pseudogymnoascus sp. 05NY08]OBT80920.1 hypothetical protein VF21_00168 [Pseudogymnoascus sp. 05NY08]